MSHSPETLQKVTGFVTRQRANQPCELLVFQHPTAGVQLPAGTVEAGEALDAAAFREVAEETGLTSVALVRHLGSNVTDLGDSHRACLKPISLLAGPFADAPRLQWFMGRGTPCRVVEIIDGFAEVVVEEVNLNIVPPKVLFRVSGWLPAEILARFLERHFYHFESMVPTPEKWIQQAEQEFVCYWVQLSPKPELVEGQREWLDYFI